MPRIRRIVLGALVSLGVVVGIYTSVQSMPAAASRATIGSHPVNIYSRSFSNSASETLKLIQSDPGERGHGCHSEHMQTNLDD